MIPVPSSNKQKQIQNLHLAHANISSELFDQDYQTEDRPLGELCNVFYIHLLIYIFLILNTTPHCDSIEQEPCPNYE